MEFYSKKPIRIDYYPKTKEDIDGFEKPEDILDEVMDYEEEPVEEDNMKCDSCMVEDMGIMEKVIEEMREDIEEVAEDIEEVKKDEAEEYMEDSIEEATDDMEEAEKTEEDIITECEED